MKKRKHKQIVHAKSFLVRGDALDAVMYIRANTHRNLTGSLEHLILLGFGIYTHEKKPKHKVNIVQLPFITDEYKGIE